MKRTSSPEQVNTSIASASADSESWGWFPFVSLASACGLLLVAVADMLSRQASPLADIGFWLGLVVIIAPIAVRLASASPSSRERVALVIVLGLALYLVKVMHSPYAFTFSDEYVHQYNAMQILLKGSLFSSNPIIPATALYPGLESVTAALASVSGLSLFVSGLIVIGLARLLLILALFLFYESIGGSARYAGIAAIIYASNSNFLFWSAQFSYESLALPLALVVLFIIARRDIANNRSEQTGFTLIALLGIMVVVSTHHISSYFLALFLSAWVLIRVYNPLNIVYFLQKRRAKSSKGNPDAGSPGDNQGYPEGTAPGLIRGPGPGWLAIVALLLVVAWLYYFARDTLGYIFPIFTNAYNSLVAIIQGTDAPRTLFRSNTGDVAPLWQRITGLTAVVLLAAGLLFGLREFWRGFQKRGLVLILALMGLAYFGTLALRFAPGAWELGNRASEYLFIGLAFLVSLAALKLWHPQGSSWLERAAFIIGMCIVFLGGVISGWSPQLILQQPEQLRVGSVILEPQGIADARWFLSNFGSNNRIVADPSSSRSFLTFGGQYAYESYHADLNDIFGTPDFPAWQGKALQNYSIRYMVFDRRTLSRNSMSGNYFDQTADPTSTSQWIDPQVFGKFENVPDISRILDSGNISIYDFIRLLRKR